MGPGLILTGMCVSQLQLLLVQGPEEWSLAVSCSASLRASCFTHTHTHTFSVRMMSHSCVRVCDGYACL